MKRIQVIYFIAFIISAAGIVGNMELGVCTPLYGKIIFGISTVLVIGKLIYWGKRGELL